MDKTFILKMILIGFLIILVMSIVLLSCVPPIDKDTLVHHLAVPKLYLKHGEMYEIPNMLFSYYPMNMELLYLIPLSFGNDILPKFIHFSFALLTVLLLFTYIRKHLHTAYALFGAVFFLSIPIILKLSITAYVDLGLIFFTTASLILLLRWLENGFQMKFLLFSSVMCGLAMGTKYNGLITLFILSLFIPFLHSRFSQVEKNNFIKSIGNSALFIIIALIVFSPWMIRNFLWTNNPFYPLYDFLFNPENPFLQESFTLLTFRSEIYGESWWQIALLPVRMFFQGQDGNPQFFDGRLNPFLFFLPFLAFYQINRDSQHIQREKKVLLAFSILFFAFAFLTRDFRIRYVSPILPLLVILSVYGVKRAFEIVTELSSITFRKIGSFVIVLLLSFAFFLNASYLMSQFKYVAPFGYITGQVSRDEYIDTYRSEYPAMRYINRNLPQDAKILFFFVGKRGYYCDREYLIDMKDYRGTHSIFREMVENSAKPEELLLELQDMGITHFLLNRAIFDEWVQTHFDNEAIQFLQTFFKGYLELTFFERDFGLFRLKDQPPD